MAANALQKANAAAKARAAARATSHTAATVRRAKVAELWGKHASISQMLTEVNAYMVREGYPAVARDTLAHDCVIVREEFAETISEAKDVRAQEHAARLSTLANRHWQHLEKAEEDGVNTASIVNNLRLIEVEIGKFDGSYSENHQHTGDLSILARVQAVIEIKPQVEPEVVPLLEDGEFALLPAPTHHPDG